MLFELRECPKHILYHPLVQLRLDIMTAYGRAGPLGEGWDGHLLNTRLTASCKSRLSVRCVVVCKASAPRNVLLRVTQQSYHLQALMQCGRGVQQACR